MTSTPHFPLIDPREQPILDGLTAIRDELTLLKSDRTTYVKTSDVMVLYNKVVEQVTLLNELRAHKPEEQNRVDRVLDGCFLLISLFFMTIGKTNDPPAAYALTSTIKRLLDHLIEVDLYCTKDLNHIAITLKDLRVIVSQGGAVYSPNLITLVTHRIDVCDTLLSEVRSRLAKLGPELTETWETLVSVLRNISLNNTKTKFSPSEVKKLQAQLKLIDDQRKDGNFLTASGEVCVGNETVRELLRRCMLWADLVLTREGHIPEEFSVVYEELVDIRNKLEKLSITQAWSLRETDLYDYQRQLDKIDESRVNGSFLDAEGKPGDLYVQRTLLYLIRKGYAFIYFLMVSSEPVSEALLPVYNQLQTLKRCLIEVKNSGGVSSPRELYPYSMKLNSLDNMRKDGKFIVAGEIPEGQGSVIGLLSECFDLSYELRVSAEEENEEQTEN